MRASKVAIGCMVVSPWVLLIGTSAASKVPGPKVDFSQEIAPIFRAQCIQCHGTESHMGKLRLDTAAGILKGGKSGPLFIPGKSAASLLIQRVTSSELGPRMPMGFSPLTPVQIATMKQWIDEGAHVSSGGAGKHWAYVAPEQHVPQMTTNPWVKNPIDSFVLAKLTAGHLKPSAPAPKATLLRRVYLDLTGLPPSVDDTNRFLADNRPNAYELVVDKLLNSPAYGEHQATPWLDLSRYADSTGYEKDLNRTMWPYRDWVIKAFNQDMPYDEFTIEQLAGDLLPNASRDQLIATGFQRNTMFNTEGGVDQGEQRWLTLVDRVSTTGSVWLGSTLGCAQCHNHKYDPFSQEDFYRMLAFYESSNEPTLDLTDPRVHEMGSELAKLEKALPKLKGNPEDYKAVLEAAQQLRGRINEMSGASALILEEKKGEYPPKTPIRIKGGYLSPGKIVTADVPKILPRLAKDLPQNRLGLAKWLVSPENPLTARVRINQMWESIYGIGLVKTVEDFGSQGEKPIYRDLLDWLAVEFINRHWSMKAMYRLIVTSNTYRQSSVETAVMREKDPENRLLARGPRFRMTAEMIRDSALQASGMLSNKVGGPSVYPDQPDGIWNTPYNDEAWQLSPGTDRLRRGLYTFWKRTSPYPSFLSFDATSRESCTVRRLRTNTPLQALTLLNDKVYLNAAHALADRMLKEGGKEPKTRLDFGFRSVMVRKPTPAESERLQLLLSQQEVRFGSNPAEAKKLLSTPTENPKLADEAAYTIVAQVILNLDEAITKE